MATTRVSQPARVAEASDVDAAGPPPSAEGELLRLIPRALRRTCWAVAASGTLMAVFLATQVAWPPVLGWWLATLGASALHVRNVGGLAARRRAGIGEAACLRRAAVSYAVLALAQAGVVVLFPGAPLFVQGVITLYCLSVTIVAVPSVLGHPLLYNAYVAGLLGPLALVWGLAPPAGLPLLDRLLMVGLVLVMAATLIGHARGVYALFVSVSATRHDRHGLNQKLREALAKAESANAAKTRFLASASHDLRQPIHALSLFSGALSLKELEPATRHIATQIERTTTVLGRQMDALLDISRLDAGVIEARPAVIDLHALLEQSLLEFQPQAEAKGLSLALTLQSGSPLRVLADPMLLTRVVQNLVGNAVKYTETGGITVSVRRLLDHLALDVRDTGIGIAAGELDHVFDEFYQVANPERDRSKGLGLGLSIVRRLTALMEVGLEVESAPGAGSCFTLLLPVAEEPAGGEATSPPAAVRQLPSRGIRVLVVDDEPAILDGMRTLLASLGFEVAVADGTAQAVPLAVARKPDLLISDMRLRAGDDGLRVVRAVRGLWPGLPALLISGDTAPNRLQEAQAEGIELLHKPVHPFVLRDAILRRVQP